MSFQTGLSYADFFVAHATQVILSSDAQDFSQAGVVANARCAGTLTEI